MLFRTGFTLLLAMACIAPVRAQTSPEYTAVQITASDTALATSINGKCQVVGETDRQAFVWKSGALKKLGFLPGTGFDQTDGPMDDPSNSSIAHAINSRGIFVGSSGGYRPIVMSGLEDCYALIGDAQGMRSLSLPLGKRLRHGEQHRIRYQRCRSGSRLEPVPGLYS